MGIREKLEDIENNHLTVDEFQELTSCLTSVHHQIHTRVDDINTDLKKEMTDIAALMAARAASKSTQDAPYAPTRAAEAALQTHLIEIQKRLDNFEIIVGTSEIETPIEVVLTRVVATVADVQARLKGIVGAISDVQQRVKNVEGAHSEVTDHIESYFDSTKKQLSSD